MLKDLLCDLTEHFALSCLRCFLLAVIILTEQQHYILTQIPFDPEVCRVLRPNENRAVHHKFEGLSSTSLLPWYCQLLIHIQSWNVQIFLRR